MFTQFEPFAISHAKAALIGIEINTIGMNIKIKTLTSVRFNNKMPLINGLAKIRCPIIVTYKKEENGIPGEFVVTLVVFR